jgi:hypothetical protein
LLDELRHANNAGDEHARVADCRGDPAGIQVSGLTGVNQDNGRQRQHQQLHQDEDQRAPLGQADPPGGDGLPASHTVLMERLLPDLKSIEGWA